MQEKQKLRRHLQQRRTNLLAPVREAWNLAITDLILNNRQWIEAKSVMAYWSIPSEVHTHSLCNEALQTGKRLFLPRCAANASQLEAVEISNMDSDLEMSGFRNIRQPRLSLPATTDVGCIDLVVVPGIGFDEQGRRLGFGAGYYDRFLPSFTLEQRLAVAFSVQIMDQIPTKEYDQPIGVIACENGWRGPLASWYEERQNHKTQNRV